MLAALHRQTEFSLGSTRVGVRPWAPNPSYGHAVPASTTGPIGENAVEELIEFIRSRGFVGIVTGALAPVEQIPFANSAFFVREELHVLTRDLVNIGRCTHRPARAHRSEIDRIIHVDNEAFEPHWRLNSHGLTDARLATAHNRLRVIKNHAEIAAYALTGRTGRNGYLQRLAVAPGQTRQGFGRALVTDSLRWLRRWGADWAFVNTQLHNSAALDLYQSLGFGFADYRLAIMQLDFQ